MTTNTDNIGNVYYNVRGLTLGKIGILSSDFQSFANTAWGTNVCYVENTVSFGQNYLDFTSFRPNSSNEVLTGTVNNIFGSTPWRFYWSPRSNTWGGMGSIKTANNNGNQDTINFATASFVNWQVATTTDFFYMVADTESFCCSIIRGNAGNYNTANWRLFCFGWPRQGLYTGADRFRNLSSLVLGNDYAQARRVTTPNTNSATALLTGDNYSISCQTSTPGANATDLWVRDNDSPNRAIGILSRNLIKTTLNIPIGAIYRNDGVDPNGSTNQFWMCVGVWGSERLLMRIWTDNIV